MMRIVLLAPLLFAWSGDAQEATEADPANEPAVEQQEAETVTPRGRYNQALVALGRGEAE